MPFFAPRLRAAFQIMPGRSDAGRRDRFEYANDGIATEESFGGPGRKRLSSGETYGSPLSTTR
jgi:hypothetical protein